MSNAAPDTLAAQVRDGFRLDGRVAAITGAASGIGRETARVLSAAGARVVLADINQNGLAETAAMLESAGSTGSDFLIHRTDMTQRNEIDGLAQAALQNMGRLDVWVNAAGIFIKDRIDDVSEEAFDRQIAVNLKGVYWGCVAAARAMRDTGGSIINISSGGGESAVPGLSVYSLTKAAVNMLTRSVAAEFGPDGIRANAVSPGWIDTPINDDHYRDASGAVDAERKAEMFRLCAAASPLGLTGVPRDIAMAILYLASDASRFVTGQILRPNGGTAMP